MTEVFKTQMFIDLKIACEITFPIIDNTRMCTNYFLFLFTDL